MVPQVSLVGGVPLRGAYPDDDVADIIDAILNKSELALDRSERRSE
jgi:hypothetical protein